MKPSVPIRQVGRAQQLVEKQRRVHCRHRSSSYPYGEFKSAFCKDCGAKLRDGSGSNKAAKKDVK